MVHTDEMTSGNGSALDQAAQNLLRSLQALSSRDESDEDSDDGKHRVKRKQGFRRSGSSTQLSAAVADVSRKSPTPPRLSTSDSSPLPQVPIKVLGRARRIPSGVCQQEARSLIGGTSGLVRQSSTPSLSRMSSSRSFGSSAILHSSQPLEAASDSSTPAARQASPALRMAARNILQDTSAYGKCALPREQAAKLQQSSASPSTLLNSDSRSDLSTHVSAVSRDELSCSASRPSSMSREELARMREELAGLKNAHSETLEELERARKELQKAQEAASDALWVQSEPSAELEWVKPEESAFNLYAERQDTWLMITC